MKIYSHGILLGSFALLLGAGVGCSDSDHSYGYRSYGYRGHDRTIDYRGDTAGYRTSARTRDTYDAYGDRVRSSNVTTVAPDGEVYRTHQDVRTTPDGDRVIRRDTTRD